MHRILLVLEFLSVEVVGIGGEEELWIEGEVVSHFGSTDGEVVGRFGWKVRYLGSSRSLGRT